MLGRPAPHQNDMEADPREPPPPRPDDPGSGTNGAPEAVPGERWSAIVTKRPVAGRVKTRLSPPLRPEEAAGLSGAMLRDAVERCAASPAFATLLSFAPAEEASWFRRSFPEIARQRPQRGRGLGERLAELFDALLTPSAGPRAASLVAIGSDQPLVSADTIARAHERLAAGADVVLGPDQGGGYCLVGLRAPHPELFTEVEMSRAETCAGTVALARARGLAVELLAPGLDVDVAEDLERLRRELLQYTGEPDQFPRHTAAFLQVAPPDRRSSAGSGGEGGTGGARGGTLTSEDR